MMAFGGVVNWTKQRLESPVILPARKQRFLVVLIVAGLIFVALTAEVVGFLLAGTVCVVVLTVAADPDRWRLSLAWGLCSSVAIYFLFTRILSVPLPRGILGI
jgi:hypothetical protein